MWLKEYLKDVIKTIQSGLSSEEPVIHPEIVRVLNNPILKEEYLDRVNNSMDGFVDVSDIIDKLDEEY